MWMLSKENEMLCILCDSPEVYKLYVNSNFTIYHCKNCDFKYKQYPDAYDYNEVQYDQDGEWLARRDKIKNSLMKAREKRFNSFKKYLSPGNFLEIGPGPGWNLKYAKDNGYQPIGIETSKKNVEYIERMHGIKCFNGPLEDANLEKNSIDNILLAHLIEHIVDPRKLILDIKNILKPNGTLLIYTPNSASYTERLIGDYNSFYNTLDHISFFSPKSITYLAKLAELEVIKSYTSEAHYDFINKMIKYIQIKLTGRRCRELSHKDHDEGKIDIYSKKKIFSIVSSGTETIRKSAVIWGWIFKVFPLFGIGSELRCIMVKK
jgi:SAM-dependent methyltransferase